MIASHGFKRITTRTINPMFDTHYPNILHKTSNDRLPSNMIYRFVNNSPVYEAVYPATICIHNTAWNLSGLNPVGRSSTVMAMRSRSWFPGLQPGVSGLTTRQLYIPFADDSTPFFAALQGRRNGSPRRTNQLNHFYYRSAHATDRLSEQWSMSQ